MFEVILTERL